MARMSSPTSPTFASPWGVSKNAFAKAIAMLVFIWILAASTRFTSNHVENQVTGGVTATDGGNASEEFFKPKVISSKPKTTTQHKDRAAVIIENRPLANLIPVILHFNSVLGPEWPIIFYTIPTTSQSLLRSAPFARIVAENRVQIRHLPTQAVFDSHRAVSLFLADTWLWEDLAPYAKILLFQTDSVICAASEAKVDDFLEYDLIGAPIDAHYGMGYNGGLSLRNRELVLDLFRRYSYMNDSEVPDAPTHMLFEDQWLFYRMQTLPDKAAGVPGASLPDQAAASKFAVETVWQERPLGFHQPMRWQKENMAAIVEYCPEVGMISGASFF